MEHDHKYFCGVGLDRSGKQRLYTNWTGNFAMCHRGCTKGNTYVPSEPGTIHWCDRCQKWFHKDCTKTAQLTRRQARMNGQDYLVFTSKELTIFHLASLPIVREGSVAKCPSSLEALITYARKSLRFVSKNDKCTNWVDDMIEQISDVEKLEKGFIADAALNAMVRSARVQWRSCPTCECYI
jgi:hypothetical protein